MFENATGTPEKPYPNPPDYIDRDPPKPNVGTKLFVWPGHQEFEKDPDETDEAIILVHGWNMTDADKRTFSNTFFKRLWWKGFKGKFCTFSWPTFNHDDDINTHIPNDNLHYIPNHYNQSEYVAWKYGPALKAYVDSIKKVSKNVAAHSMGNVVMASALKSGLTINSYVAMQAAIPRGCYSGDANGYEKFIKADESKPTPDIYGGLLAGINGNFSNFFSANDYALKTGKVNILWHDYDSNWEANQVDYKPDSPKGYSTSRINSISPFSSSVGSRPFDGAPPLRNVTDPHELMAFVARPRSEALGVRDTTGFIGYDLADDTLSYPFGKDRTEHSGQFQRPIQKTEAFYKKLLQTMGVGFIDKL